MLSDKTKYLCLIFAAPALHFIRSGNAFVMKKILIIAVCIISLLYISQCTKEPLNNLTESEGRIYITNHDESAGYSSYSTFSIADSVAVIENNQLTGRALTAVDAAYIEAVKTQMQQKGYTLVNKDAGPDLAISVNRIFNSYTGVFNYADYWGYYNGYWDPYYWGYPGYDYLFPTSYGYYQVTEGALSIDMFDLVNAADNNNNIKGIWNGLIRGSGIFRVENANDGVKILFDQSTYLQTN